MGRGRQDARGHWESGSSPSESFLRSNINEPYLPTSADAL